LLSELPDLSDFGFFPRGKKLNFWLPRLLWLAMIGNDLFDSNQLFPPCLPSIMVCAFYVYLSTHALILTFTPTNRCETQYLKVDFFNILFLFFYSALMECIISF
jgi:hypothetical protein